MNPQKFARIVREYHEKSGRHDLPWRRTRDPYRILVSEIMLQQTQVARVMAKYPEFLKEFPTVQALAKAPTAKLLRVWQGLGYNRRALNLKRAAEGIVRDFGGRFPKDAAALESLPGIGQSTRGALMAFAFGLPTVFIETNIRAVYLHHFFKEKTGVHDRDIFPLIEKTLDKEDPRAWYYALMDYGVHLKATLPNPSRTSRHHVRQSAFKGSNRELRSNILKEILKKPRTAEALQKTIGRPLADIRKNLANLQKEGFICKKKASRTYCIL